MAVRRHKPRAALLTCQNIFLPDASPHTRIEQIVVVGILPATHVVPVETLRRNIGIAVVRVGGVVVEVDQRLAECDLRQGDTDRYELHIRQFIVVRVIGIVAVGLTVGIEAVGPVDRAILVDIAIVGRGELADELLAVLGVSPFEIVLPRVEETDSVFKSHRGPIHLQAVFHTDLIEAVRDNESWGDVEVLDRARDVEWLHLLNVGTPKM